MKLMYITECNQINAFVYPANNVIQESPIMIHLFSMYSLHFLIIYIKNNTGNSTQYTVIAYRGKESKKKWIYVYGKLVHFVVHLKHNIANQVDYNKNENKTKHKTQTNKNNTYPI